MEVSAIQILNNKRGASFIWVLCLMLVALVIGGSILSAAGMAAGNAVRYRNAKICSHYTNELADELIRGISGSFPLRDDNPWYTNPWYTIAQSVYDAKMRDPANTVTLDDVALNVGFTSANGATPTTTANIVLTQQSVTITQHYAAATTNDETGEDIPEQPEKASVQFNMSIELRTVHAGHTYIVYLRFRFRGDTEGGDGNGRIMSGNYTFNGLFDTP